MMGIVMPEAYLAYKKYNKIISNIYLFFYSLVLKKLYIFVLYPFPDYLGMTGC